MKIGINGFGRIGRQIFRVLHERGLADDIVLINDLMPNETMAQLLKYDSNYGKFKGEVSFDDDGMTVDGHTVKVTALRNPAEIPWGENGVDIVVESTGLFTKRADAAKHIEGGAKKVLISAPSADSDFDIMMGVNAYQYDADSGQVVSNASCTTNSLAALMKIMDDTFGVEQAMMTTISLVHPTTRTSWTGRTKTCAARGAPRPTSCRPRPGRPRRSGKCSLSSKTTSTASPCAYRRLRVRFPT